MTLYEQIGEAFIHKAITDFYLRAFEDPIIGHLFIKFDREHITKQQIAFSIGMLGGPKTYVGKPLKAAHGPLPLKRTHFMRRQILMREVIDELGLDKKLADQWMALEDQLKPLIINDQAACNT